MSDETFYAEPIEAIYAHGSGTGGAHAPTRDDLFENALALLADGIALLRHDGGIVYANSALRHLAESNGDFRVDRNMIEFASPDLHHRFATALVAVERVQKRENADLVTDFAVPREDGRPPYSV